MHEDFWRVKPKRKPESVSAPKNSTGLELLHVPVSCGEYIIQTFLADLHDGLVPGAEMTMNSAALAELEFRVSRAIRDAYDDREYMEPDDIETFEDFEENEGGHDNIPF